MMRNFLKYIVLAVAVSAGAGAWAMPEAAPAEQRIDVAQPTVKAFTGKIEITVPGDEAHQVAIFALTGQCVKTISAQPGVTAVELPAGYYIVKVDRLSQRVIVR